jgi:hypothetical protein
MSLEEDAQTWANKIVSFYTENLNADKMNESVRTSGFDIKENSKLLEKFYENKLSKC